MENKKPIGLIILGVFLAAIAAFVIYVLYTIPIYHAFSKRVVSTEELRSALPDSDIIIPDLEQLGMDPIGICELKLDGRQRNSKGIGYYMTSAGFAEEIEGYGCDCYITCVPQTSNYTRNDKQYNGIDISEYLSTYQASAGITYIFDLSGYEYTLECIYSTGKILSEEASVTARNEIREKLYSAVCKLIDMKND